MALSALLEGALSILRITGLDRVFGGLLFGDKGADVAEQVVGVARAVTGSTDISDAVARLEADKELQQQFNIALMEQERALFELAASDRADARHMQIEAMEHDDPFVRRFIYNFAWFWSIVSAGFIFLIIVYPIPEDNLRFADVVLGFVLGTIIGTIVQFFYGSMLKTGSK